MDHRSRYDHTVTDHSSALDRVLQQVVLDWNGTVVADQPRALDATNAVLAAHGLAPISDADFGQLFSLPLHRFLGRLAVPEAALADAEASWNRHSMERKTMLSRGAPHLLTACLQHGVPVGILTAADPALVIADADRLGIRGLLSWISGPSHDKAADLLDRTASPGHVAYVGDTADDITYARRAGALAVAFTGGYHHQSQLQAAGPDLMISDLSQLIPFLRTRSLPTGNSHRPVPPDSLAARGTPCRGASGELAGWVTGRACLIISLLAAVKSAISSSCSSE
jgi:phosphoglycolate phosphatase-like HAD superfamily hydrolase